MTIGNKIRRVRTSRNLSQKQLAEMVGLSEPAIRNYELGNRTPSQKQIRKIAQALDINEYALSDPNLVTKEGIMHVLFELEDRFGLEPVEINHQIYLAIDPVPRPKTDKLYRYWGSWLDEKEDLEQKKITREEYDQWRHSFPEGQWKYVGRGYNRVAFGRGSKKWLRSKAAQGTEKDD